ncbi:hypothetical protein F2Q68_00030148 [Brassica cretica]|uniref:Uncharacterized protein n=1 Tax=Brassica cretica TaxID=69181 RepID=A0A8S9GDI5_BRACR|nr:hypothetical protein F2Q68_00030148 [Brassica cretica]
MASCDTTIGPLLHRQARCLTSASTVFSVPTHGDVYLGAVPVPVPETFRGRVLHGDSTGTAWGRLENIAMIFLICEAGLLIVVAETLCHVTLLLLFRCFQFSTSSLIREVCICNKFSLLKRLCDHVLHPLCSFARVLLMHMTVFKLLLGQVLMAIFSTSYPQFVILYYCKLLFQKLLKFEKMSYVIYLGQSYTF